MATGARDGPRALQRILTGLPGELHPGASLAALTTFRIGGPAWAAYRPASPEGLVEAVSRCRAAGIPWRLLGGGSNVLMPDAGFPGLVVLTGGLAEVSPEGDLIVAQAGVPLQRLAPCGFPFLAGIPGTVGGGVITNAGTREGDIGDRVAWVEVLAPDGTVSGWDAAACGFAYRDSRLRRLGLPVLRAALRPLAAAPVAALLARRRATQPTGLASAGCVFRNPLDAPPAGWLIDRAGLKGARVGDAVVGPRHANFICNLGRARAAHVLTLVDQIRARVVQMFGVWLELELEVVSG
ncbi:MAG: UDP-N-acetylmuramate dehydrogenase [Candidatus Bipolaricaulaceae bacterium]